MPGQIVDRGMGNFFADLKRRHIYRVAAAYAVIAWVLIQLVNTIAPMLHLPDWGGTLVLVLLFVGFPVALLFAWIHQLAPESGILTHATTGKLDWALIAALVIVIALVSYQQLAVPRATVTATPQSGVDAARAAAASSVGISIAVLPFANVSADADQEFFSDGITDEISGTLAKIPDLRVVGRSSAFRYKKGDSDLRAIGQALGATHLIEGSVRKAGNRVRITAQLVQAENGLQVWTDNYDRELTDIFAIQEDIARAIAASLRMPLGLKSGENLVSSRTRNESSYEKYLRAIGLVRTRNTDREAEAAKILEQVVGSDPDFAAAWALLGLAYNDVPLNQLARFGGDVEKMRPMVNESLAKAEAAAQRAIQLDPKIPDGYSVLSSVQHRHGKFLLAAELEERALALDRNFPEALNAYSILLAELGYLKQAILVRRKLVELEPFVPAFGNVYSRILFAAGLTDEAIAQVRQGNTILAEYRAAQGRFGDAIDVVQATLKDPYVNGEPSLLRVTEAAVKVLRTAPKPSDSPKSLPKLAIFGWAYMYVGAPERYLDNYEDSLKLGFFGSEAVLLWTPQYKVARQTERFKTYVRNRGVLEYWRAKGWPDQCRPVGADDFVCD